MNHKNLHNDLSDILEKIKPNIEENQLSENQVKNIELYLKGASKMLVNVKMQHKFIEMGFDLDVPFMEITADECKKMRSKPVE